MPSIAGDFGGIGGGQRRRLGAYFGLSFASPWAAPTDLATLIANLGGNSVVLGMYDTRYGITLNSTNVASWADARGSSGFGPTLSAIGTQQPAFASHVITFNGTTNGLFSSTVALYNVSQTLSTFFVGSATTAGTAQDPYLQLADFAATAHGIYITTPVVTDITAGYQASSFTFVTSVVAPPTSRSLFAASATATTLALNIAGNTQVTTALSGLASSANGGLCLGAQNNSGTLSNFTALSVVACGVLLGAYTGTQYNTLHSWAQSIWASS
jgi:hypothetical protein